MAEWKQSDFVTDLTAPKGNALLRLLVGTDDVTPKTLEPILMELTVPNDVTVALVQHDTAIPAEFSTDAAPDPSTPYQFEAALYLEAPEDFAETRLYFMVQDEYQRILTTAVVGPDGDDDDEGCMTLDFTVTVAPDRPTIDTSNWSHPATSNWS